MVCGSRDEAEWLIKTDEFPSRLGRLAITASDFCVLALAHQESVLSLVNCFIDLQNAKIVNIAFFSLYESASFFRERGGSSYSDSLSIFSVH